MEKRLRFSYPYENRIFCETPDLKQQELDKLKQQILAKLTTRNDPGSSS